MSTITWIPGTNPKLDKFFDDLREKQFQDKTHRLWKNYAKTEFDYLKPVALTIDFDDSGEPYMCSSIAARNCWPTGVYRIHNRSWKAGTRSKLLDHMSAVAYEQAKWLQENTDCALYFISRSTTHWEKWMIGALKKEWDMDFTTDEYYYLTCPNVDDKSCWQKIIYNGDSAVLESWSRKQTR